MRKLRFHVESWRSGILIVLLTGIVVAGLLLTNRSPSVEAVTEASTVPYSHRVHVQEVGVQCGFCHSSAYRAPQAGLPSLQRCMACHQYFTADEPEAQEQILQVANAFEDNINPQWPDVYRQPDFVYFSHRPHVSAGVECQTCHGDVENMDLVVKQVEMNMGFCLNCHRQQPEDDLPRLLDCNTCHK